MFDRPVVDYTGAGAFPMMVLEERTLQPRLFEHIPFPATPWAQAMSCLSAHGVDTAGAGPAPELLVVPVARTIRVADMTRDSLEYARDSTRMGSAFAAPTIAYSLVRTGVVLVVERYSANVPLLRHEALHFILWRARKLYGHPGEFYWPCDRAYQAAP